MFSSILSAIAAIPALLKAIQELTSWFQKANEEKWFLKNSEAFDQLKKAQTDEEKLNAVKAIQNSLRNI